MDKYKWVVFDNESEGTGEIRSCKEDDKVITLQGYSQIENTEALTRLRNALLESGYEKETGTCAYLDRLIRTYNPDSACWVRSDVAIERLGVDPIDCLPGISSYWLRHYFSG